MFDEKEALQVCQKLIKKHELPMKVLEAKEGEGGVRFSFTAPEKTDFRLLSRDLNRHFKRKIDLIELSPRKAASLLPGCGKCGRPLCCRTFLKNPPHIPTSILGDLKLKGSPDEYTGACGKLLCCLLYGVPKEKPAITETRKPSVPPRPEPVEEFRDSVLPKPKPRKHFIRRLIKI